PLRGRPLDCDRWSLRDVAGGLQLACTRAAGVLLLLTGRSLEDRGSPAIARLVARAQHCGVVEPRACEPCTRTDGVVDLECGFEVTLGLPPTRRRRREDPERPRDRAGADLGVADGDAGGVRPREV